MLSLTTSLSAQATDVRTVAPALEKYTQGRLLGEVWKRPGLSPRDRSIVTLAALIARNQMIEMPYYLNVALDLIKHTIPKLREMSAPLYSGDGNR